MPTVSGGIDVRVLQEDGLLYPAEVLVLKHAQALYGLDRRVVELTGIPQDRLPLPGHARVFRDVDGIGSRALVFVGTRFIAQFSYQDVRRFGYEALHAVAGAFPSSSEIALTLHGVGYGLDEMECFDAEIAGMVEAIERGHVSESLKTISILEADPKRADRLSARLAFLFSSRSSSGPLADERSPARTLRLAGNEDGRAHAFVAMPFDKSFSNLFDYAISQAVRANGLLCERIDRQVYTGDILERVRRQIRSATLVIADVTGGNPNVFLEVGLAWGHGVPTLLICREGEPLPFDVRGQRCIYYDGDVIRDFETRLQGELRRLLVDLQ
jgi:hypothetical protein